MADGKISAAELHRQIMDLISKQLGASSSFNNNSLSYYGAEIRYKIEVKLWSRGLTQEVASKEAVLGESEATAQQLLDRENGVRLEGEPIGILEASHVAIENSVVAGTAKGLVGSQTGSEKGSQVPAGDQQGRTGGAPALSKNVGHKPTGGGGKAGSGPAGGTGGPAKGTAPGE